MKEGDTYDAANTNAEIDSLVTLVNDLTFADNVRPRALGSQHLPSVLANDDGVDVNRGDGMNVGTAYPNWPASGFAFDDYSNVLSPSPRSGNPVDIQTFVASPVGAGAGIGWRVVSSSASIADSCSVVWGVGGTTWSDHESILVSASICIGRNSRDQGQGLSEFPIWQHCFALAFAIEDTAGNRYCVPRTVRCFQAITSLGERVSLTALLNADDLTAAAAEHGGNANARRVSLIFGRFIPDDSSSDDLDGVGWIALGPFNISQMPMKHGTIS